MFRRGSGTRAVLCRDGAAAVIRLGVWLRLGRGGRGSHWQERCSGKRTILGSLPLHPRRCMNALTTGAFGKCEDSGLLETGFPHCGRNDTLARRLVLPVLYCIARCGAARCLEGRRVGVWPANGRHCLEPPHGKAKLFRIGRLLEVHGGSRMRSRCRGGLPVPSTAIAVQLLRLAVDAAVDAWKRGCYYLTLTRTAISMRSVHMGGEEWAVWPSEKQYRTPRFRRSLHRCRICLCTRNVRRLLKPSFCDRASTATCRISSSNPIWRYSKDRTEA
jgi:hypothetical protein